MVRDWMLSPMNKNDQGCLFLPLLFSIVFEVLVTIHMSTKGNKRHANWKGRTKTVPIHRKHGLYIGNTKESSRT